jgi:hypothetical protein
MEVVDAVVTASPLDTGTVTGSTGSTTTGEGIMLEKDTIGSTGDTECVSGSSDDIVNSSIGFADGIMGSMGSMLPEDI